MQATRSILSPVSAEMAGEARAFASPSAGAAPFDPHALARRVRRLTRRQRHAEIAGGRGRLWAARATLVAPLRATRTALHAVRQYGEATQAHDGISRARQFAWLWWLALRYEMSPGDVYRYRLFSRARVLPTPTYTGWQEAGMLYRALIPLADRATAETLADKRRFAAWCAARGLPTPPILLEFADGQVAHRTVPEGQTPPTDLFAKWATAFGGDDTQRWRWIDGHHVDDAGRAWHFDEIVTALAERSRKGVVLLQPRLVNHPALRPLSPNALSTIRVMTTQRPGAAPRFLASVLRMGTGAATADNFAQGGIASAIDAATGVTGPARRLDKQHRTFVHDTHPDTGAPIVGLRVPFWNEAIDLALRAHAELGEIACVGWDVAVLDDGPVLLEGNWNPCTKLLQIATQTPLLSTEFAATYDAWLTKYAGALDDRWLVAQDRWKPVEAPAR